jgi:high affinity Mn2+ porin
MRHSLTLPFLCLAAALGAGAQTAPLPDAPVRPATLLAPPVAKLDSLASPQNGPSAARESPPPVPPAPAADEAVVTMFPHTQTGRYWISGQYNSIFQAKPGFHSPYQGPNSLDNAGEYKVSILDTLFLGFQPHRDLRYNTDFIVDFEEAGGRGLGEALGLAGFTNLDVVRNPYLSTAPYLARGEIHQTIGLTSEMAESDRDQLSLATEVPVRRFEIRVGKMTLPDIFDQNDILSDSYHQFENWTVDNAGTWDYAADTRGYTTGGMIEYDDRNWSFRYGIFAMPTVANGITLDWAFSRARGQNWEFDWNHSFLRGRKGVIRILSFANAAHMGNYRLAVQDYLAGLTPTPVITSVERFGTVKYGFEWNSQQEITDNLRVASRVGWNDDQEESYAYTECGQTVLVGADYAGTRWHRAQDKVGLAFVSNAIKKDHQNYLKYGGLGFVLGDGHLNYGRENTVEGYYTWHVWRGIFNGLDLQHVDDPGYNRDRGPVWVFSVHGHVDF